MTRDEFLHVFERSLLVGGQSRRNILDELKTHADELPDHADIQAALGRPAVLATSFNRVHLGFWSSRLRLFSAPTLLAAAIFITAQWNLTVWQSFSRQDPSLGLITGDAYTIPNPPLWFFKQIVGLILPLVLAFVIGRALAKFHEPRSHFVRLMALTLGLSAITASTTIHHPVYILEAALQGALILAGIAMFGYLLSVPLNPPTRTRQSTRVGFDILLHVFVGLLGAVVLLGLTEAALAPYDLLPPELRPSPNAWTFINDFFEAGIGAWLPSALFLGFVLWHLTSRIRAGRNFKQINTSAGRNVDQH